MEYKIIELEDMSSAAKRISAKVLVDVDRSNKGKVEQLILKLVEELKRKKIEKERTVARHGLKPFEVVYVYLYRNIDEKNHGLPLARASFIDPSCRVKPFHFSKEFVDENTTISYDSTYEALNDLVKENKVSNDTFIEKLSEQVEALSGIYEIVKSNADDFDLLAKEFEGFEVELREMQDNFIGFPNDEYMELYNRHQSALASLSNIGIALLDGNYNEIQKHHLVVMNFDKASEDMEYLLNELR